jgi:hypothetical protein
MKTLLFLLMLCQQIWFLSPSARSRHHCLGSHPMVSADLVPFTVGETAQICLYYQFFQVSADLVPFTVGEPKKSQQSQQPQSCQQIWFLSPSASNGGGGGCPEDRSVSRSGSFHRRRVLAFLRLIFKCDLSILRAPCRYKFPDHFVAVVISNSGRLIKVISSRALVHVCLHHHPARRTVSRILLSSARGARGIEADDTPARFQPL